MAVLAPIAIVTVVAISSSLASGIPVIDGDPVWRERQLHDFATIVSLLTLHSVVATVGCWLIARRQRLV